MYLTVATSLQMYVLVATLPIARGVSNVVSESVVRGERKLDKVLERNAVRQPDDTGVNWVHRQYDFLRVAMHRSLQN